MDIDRRGRGLQGGHAMRRGEIRWVALDQAHRQTRAQRPAVIVSNDGANTAAGRRGAGVVTVVPLSMSAGEPRPFRVALPEGAGGLPRPARALADQVRTVSAERLGPSIGALSIEHMRAIDAALRFHLGL